MALGWEPMRKTVLPGQFMSLTSADPCTHLFRYIGAWGVVEALKAGANIVVTGRTTDASAVLAASAWWHRWSETQYDELAQAVLCGEPPRIKSML